MTWVRCGAGLYTLIGFNPEIRIIESDRKWYVSIGGELVPDTFTRLQKAKAFVYSVIKIVQNPAFHL